jgi:hypothetical protein
MDIFLSYASEQRAAAEEIALALRGEGHSVFFDRSELPEGEAYNARIREAIAASDLLVFLVSPESVTAGRYTLTELDFAEEKWRSPAGRVLPVLVKPVDKAAVPAYLRAVVMLRPAGNIAAEVAAAADRLLKPRWLRLLRRVVLPLAIVALAAGGWGAWRGIGQWRACGEASRQADAARLQQGAGDYAAAWEGFGAALALCPGSDEVQLAQERLAMEWLENARATEGRTTFSQIVEPLLPVLSRAAAGQDDRRAADALAHLGWADFLRSREGEAGLDPEARYRRALERDAANPHAHAFLAHHILVNDGGVTEAMAHFRQALAAAELRPFVRALQIGALRWRSVAEAEDTLVRVGDEMRRQGEALPEYAGEPNISPFWDLYYRALVSGGRRDEFLALLPPSDHVATYQWLLSSYNNASNRSPWLFMRAQLEENAGDRTAALVSYDSLVSELAARGADSGRLPDAARRALRRLRSG